MRFKGKLINAVRLVQIFQAIEKVRKECIVKLCKSQIMFISRGSDTLGAIAAKEDNTQIWSGVPTQLLFGEFKVESLKTNNQIYILINVEHAIRALRSRQSTDSIMVRLTKKNAQTYLTLDMRIMAQNGQIALSQDIPVLQTLLQADIDTILEPITNPRVQIMMPPLKELKPIIDRMQKMGSILEIEANMNGCITFQMHSQDMIKVSTYFKNLRHPHTITEDNNRFNVEIIPQRNTPDEQISVLSRLEIKKFQRFLHSQILQPQNIVLGMVHDSCLVLNVNAANDIYMTYYLFVIRE